MHSIAMNNRRKEKRLPGNKGFIIPFQKSSSRHADGVIGWPSRLCLPPLGFSAQAGDFTGDWVFLSCAGFLISRLHQGSVVCGWYDDLGSDAYVFCAGEALLTMQRGFEVAKQGVIKAAIASINGERKPPRNHLRLCMTSLRRRELCSAMLRLHARLFHGLST